MKRWLALLLALLITVSLAACAGNAAVPVNSTVESSPVSVSGPSSKPSEDVSSAVSGSTAQKSPWPTKEWSTSTPKEQGLNPDVLAQADQRIAENYPNVYSLLVVRHGYLVYEKYYNGMNQDSANPVYSVTKSVLSALTGIALREKLISGVDQKVADLLPEYFEKAEDAKKEITVKHVLTMSGGLESIDLDYYGYFTSKDWLAYALQKPLLNNPGEQFAYNTGLTHFLSGIITKASGMDTKEFAKKYLFSQIGMSFDRWDKDPTGHYSGGTGLYLTPRNMAKFGYLYLNNGQWDGKQVIPEEWVKDSSQKQISVAENVDYGYLFWMRKTSSDAAKAGLYSYQADGAGGQKILMIPELDMVAVVTAGEQLSSSDGKDTQEILADYIAQAVIN